MPLKQKHPVPENLPCQKLDVVLGENLVVLQDHGIVCKGIYQNKEIF